MYPCGLFKALKLDISSASGIMDYERGEENKCSVVFERIAENFWEDFLYRHS